MHRNAASPGNKCMVGNGWSPSPFRSLRDPTGDLWLLLSLSRSAVRCSQLSSYCYKCVTVVVLICCYTAASVASVACCSVALLRKAEQGAGKRQEIETVSSTLHSSPWFGDEYPFVSFRTVHSQSPKHTCVASFVAPLQTPAIPALSPTGN